MSKKNRKKKQNADGSNSVRTVLSILGGSFLAKKSFVSQIPFMATITILLMVLITNTYIAESRVREIDKANKQLSDLRAKYVELKSDILEASLQSALIKKLEGTGIKESLDPLFRIEGKENETGKEEQE